MVCFIRKHHLSALSCRSGPEMDFLEEKGKTASHSPSTRRYGAVRRNILTCVVVGIGCLAAACSQSSNVDPAQDSSTMASNNELGNESSSDESVDRESGAVDRSASVEPAADSGPVSEPADVSSLSSYFPMDSDKRWEYQVEVHQAGTPPKKSTATKTVGDATAVEGKRYIQVMTKATMPVPPQLYRMTDDGIYAAVDGSPGNEMLILPADPKRKTNWTGSAPPIIKNLSGKATVNESYQAVNRKYENCIKVTLSMTIDPPGFFAPKNVPVRLIAGSLPAWEWWERFERLV